MTAPLTLASTQSIVDRFDRTHVALRIAIVLAGLGAVAAIRVAATAPQPVLDLAIVVLVGSSALFPDGHSGLAAVALVGVDWALAVDDPSTPWVMAVGAAVATFHSALALATIAPVGARLERATGRRWVRRTALVVALVPPTWIAVIVADRLELAANQLLVGLALLVIALTAMWSRHGELGQS